MDHSILLFFPLYLSKFRLQSSLAGGEFVQFCFQLLGRRKFGEPGLLDFPGGRLEQDDLALKPTQEFFLVLRRLVSVIDWLQLAVGVDLLSQKGKVGDPLFRIPQVFPGTDGGGDNSIAPFHQFLIAANAVFSEKVHSGSRPFQILNGRPPLVSGALLGLDIVLNINEQTDLPIALPGLPGGPGASGNPGGNGFFRVIGAQSFEPGKPLLVRHPGGDILSPLDFVSFPLQPGKQIFRAGGRGDQPVNGGFQLCLVAGAVLCGLMLDVALALVPAWYDDGQAVFFAQPVAGPAYLVIAALVGMVVLVVGEADRIKNQMVVNMSPVNMGGKYKLVLATQYFFCQLHPDLMGFLGGDLPRLKSLDQVTAQVCALVNGMSACPFKFNVSGLGGASEGGHQQFSIRLVGIADIVNGRFQR